MENTPNEQPRLDTWNSPETVNDRIEKFIETRSRLLGAVAIDSLPELD